MAVDPAICIDIVGTVMIRSFWTDLSGQIVQTQIRLLLETGSSLFAITADPDQTAKSLHYLQYCLHLLGPLLYSKTSFSQF